MGRGLMKIKLPSPVGLLAEYLQGGGQHWCYGLFPGSKCCDEVPESEIVALVYSDSGFDLERYNHIMCSSKTTRFGVYEICIWVYKCFSHQPDRFKGEKSCVMCQYVFDCVEYSTFPKRRLDVLLQKWCSVPVILAKK